MNCHVLRAAFLLAVAAVYGRAQEKPEVAQVTLPAAEKSTPEFSSRKMDLAQCVALALEQNTEIRRAKEEVKRREGVAIQVRSELLPKVTAQGNFDYQNKSLSGFLVESGFVSADEMNWTAGIRVTQMLFDGGAGLSRTKAARIAQSQSVLLLQNTIDQVMLEVRRTVYAVLLNRSLIDVQTEAVDLREQQLNLQQKKFKAGTVTKFNVLTADVELANTMPQLIRARNNKRIAEVQLARILALDYPLEQPDDWMPPVEVVGDLPYQPAAVNLETSLINGVNNRPDLRATKDELRAQQELIKAAKADAFIPKIVGSGGYDVIQDQSSSSFTKSLQGPVANINGTWTLFDGLQTTGRLEQLKAQFAAAEIALEEKRREVESQVRDAVVKLEEAQELVISQQKNVEQARESLRLAEARFNVGAGIQLDIINAQSNLTQARYNELQGRYDYNVALALLERATASPLGPQNPPPVPKPSASIPNQKPKVSLQAAAEVRPQPGQ
ncbi:MAG: TolC family protein [Candidatus Methylacidiphilales bacterium]